MWNPRCFATHQHNRVLPARTRHGSLTIVHSPTTMASTKKRVSVEQAVVVQRCAWKSARGGCAKVPLENAPVLQEGTERHPINHATIAWQANTPTKSANLHASSALQALIQPWKVPILPPGALLVKLVGSTENLANLRQRIAKNVFVGNTKTPEGMTAKVKQIAKSVQEVDTTIVPPLSCAKRAPLVSSIRTKVRRIKIIIPALHVLCTCPYLVKETQSVPTALLAPNSMCLRVLTLVLTAPPGGKATHLFFAIVATKAGSNRIQVRLFACPAFQASIKTRTVKANVNHVLKTHTVLQKIQRCV